MTISTQKHKKSSKKINYLLKECRTEMNEMKCELFDLQNALNACRTSLGSLNITDTGNSNLTSSPKVSQSKVSTLIPFKLALPTSSSSMLSTSPASFTSSTSSTSKLTKATKVSTKGINTLFSNNNSVWTSTMNDSLTSTSLSNVSQSSSYPYTYSYNFMRPVSTSRYFKQLKKMNRQIKSSCRKNLNSQFAETTLTTTATTEDYSKLSSFDSNSDYKYRKFGLDPKTPVCAWKNDKHLKQFFYRPGKTLPKPSKNKIKIYNHLNQSKRMARIERKRSRIQSIFEINASEANHKIHLEKTHIKNQQIISPISCISDRSERFDKFQTSSKSGSLKDHFMVINHKNELNQSLFEPKHASTPIYKEPLTSTPVLLDNSMLDQVLNDLITSNNRMNKCKMSKKINMDSDFNKHSDYFSSSTQNDIEAMNDYDIPEPRLSQHEYQIPNKVLIYSTCTKSSSLKYDECPNENSCDQLSETNNTLLTTSNLACTSTPVKSRHNLDINNNNFNSKNEFSINKEKEASQGGCSSTFKSVKQEINLYELGNLTSASVSTITSSKNSDKKSSCNYFQAKQLKNTTIMSTVSSTSSVRSTVIKCCIKPFRNLIQSKNVKKCLKKL